MKRIGIIGGLSAESTAHFYSSLTRLYVERFNNTNYPEIVVFSVQFQTFMDWSNNGNWDKYADGLVEGLASLEAAGADFAVISANTPHIVYEEVRKRAHLPLLHIADAIAGEAHAKGYSKVALLGTIQTMEAAFYPDRLKQFGISCIVPDAREQGVIRDVLEKELYRGMVNQASGQRFVEIINTLKGRGAEAVILGCTEIPLLVSDRNSPLPVLDSTMLFVAKTLDEAMK